MKVENAVQQIGTPLYQQLLVLIPLLKIIEDTRRSSASRLVPLRLDLMHRISGELTVALSETRLSGDVKDKPEMAITIQSHTRNNNPLTYQDTFIFAWTFFCNMSSTDELTQKAMYEPFMKAWWTYVLRHEQTIQTMGLV